MPFEKGTEQLSIPERTLRTLSFCEPTPRQMSEWIEHLPMVNLGEASRQLYHAIIELNQLIIEPETRIKLLELLRTPIQFICSALSKHYLNKPILLPDKARKVSRLAMALDNHLAVGYKIVVFDNSETDYSLRSRKAKKASLLAIHRAISTLTKTIVRSCQLYIPPPERAWREMHQLYLIAESNKAQDITIEDRENLFLTKSTIADSYKRALMLGCCKPNQIRQRDIKHIYDATEMWSKHVQITHTPEQANFIINLGSDAPPIHRDLARKKLTPFYRGVLLTDLLKLLKEYLAQPEDIHDTFVKGVSVPRSVSADLVRCLVSAWESLTDRSFSRVPSDKTVKLCLGFSATHFFVSGGVDFEDQLQHGPEAAPANSKDAFIAQDVASLENQTDAWAAGFDVGKGDFIRGTTPANLETINIDKDRSEAVDIQQEVMPVSAVNPEYDVQLVDTSPNGYCLKWQDVVPQEVKTGEIIAVNEGAGHAWSIGVIRWINHVTTTETLMGIELIAPGAIPCGVKVVTKAKRRSDYMRGLLLPALQSMDQPASIFTPNLPFKEGVKVILNQYGEVSHGYLGERLSATGAFSHFVYEPELGADIRDESDDNIEDMWPDI